MNWPPPLLPTNITNATPQLNIHPANHNDVNLAVNDIVEYVELLAAQAGDRLRAKRWDVVWTAGGGTGPIPYTGGGSWFGGSQGELYTAMFELTSTVQWPLPLGFIFTPPPWNLPDTYMYNGHWRYYEPSGIYTGTIGPADVQRNQAVFESRAVMPFPATGQLNYLMPGARFSVVMWAGGPPP